MMDQMKVDPSPYLNDQRPAEIVVMEVVIVAAVAVATAVGYRCQ